MNKKKICNSSKAFILNHAKNQSKEVLKNELATIQYQREDAKRMCSTCPWRNNSPLKDGWKTMIDSNIKDGTLKSKLHRCHEIDLNNTWNEVNDSNVCIGSLKV